MQKGRKKKGEKLRSGGKKCTSVSVPPETANGVLRCGMQRFGGSGVRGFRGSGFGAQGWGRAPGRGGDAGSGPERREPSVASSPPHCRHRERKGRKGEEKIRAKKRKALGTGKGGREEGGGKARLGGETGEAPAAALRRSPARPAGRHRAGPPRRVGTAPRPSRAAQLRSPPGGRGERGSGESTTSGEGWSCCAGTCQHPRGGCGPK